MITEVEEKTYQVVQVKRDYIMYTYRRFSADHWEFYDYYEKRFTQIEDTMGAPRLEGQYQEYLTMQGKEKWKDYFESKQWRVQP